MSLLDYLDAQRTYRETALEHLRTVGAYWGAVYQLEAAVGGSLRGATEGGSLRGATEGGSLLGATEGGSLRP